MTRVKKATLILGSFGISTLAIWVASLEIIDLIIFYANMLLIAISMPISALIWALSSNKS